MDAPSAEGGLDPLLDALAAPPAGPAGGAGAALALALAAALVTMVGRASGDAWDDARGVAAQAHALRTRALELAAVDAQVFSTALAALRRPADAAGGQPALGAAMDAAAEAPLRIAELSADVAALAALAAQRGVPDMRPDAAVAAILAAACARAATHLVEVNLTVAAGDPRLACARAAAEAAVAAREQALADR